MKFKFPECVPHNGLQAFAHETLSLVASEGVETQIPTTKHTEDDVRNVDDADDILLFTQTDEEAHILRFRNPFEIVAELNLRRGRDDPWAVQYATGTDASQELWPVFRVWLTDENTPPLL